MGAPLAILVNEHWGGDVAVFGVHGVSSKALLRDHAHMHHNSALRWCMDVADATVAHHCTVIGIHQVDAELLQSVLVLHGLHKKIDDGVRHPFCAPRGTQRLVPLIDGGVVSIMSCLIRDFSVEVP